MAAIDDLKAGMTATADAIRNKTGSDDLIMWSAEAGFANAVDAINTGTNVSGEINITENGTYDVTNYASAIVNVAEADDTENAVIPWLTREITEYSNSTLTTLGAYALSGTNITSLNLPALTTIAGYTFYECTKLTEVVFPSLIEIPYNGFRSFKGLVKADFHVLTKIGSNGLYQCTNLEALIIRNESLCTLVSGTTLTGSKIANGTGYIYVPSSLVDSYKVASNWSAFTDQFRAIEDYPNVCG